MFGLWVAAWVFREASDSFKCGRFSGPTTTNYAGEIRAEMNFLIFKKTAGEAKATYHGYHFRQFVFQPHARIGVPHSVPKRFEGQRLKFVPRYTLVTRSIPAKCSQCMRI